jgi:hypothetical protein
MGTAKSKELKSEKTRKPERANRIVLGIIVLIAEHRAQERCARTTKF